MTPSLRPLWLLLVLAASLPHRAAGQKFAPGYIVPLSGDTLRGEVQVRGDMRSATRCSFRPPGGATTDYAATQLQAYGLQQGANFQAHTLPPTDSSIPEIAFVKVLVVGQASLYEYRDRDDHTRYYVAVGTGLLQELRKIRVQRSVGDQVVYEEQYPFRAVLARALHACLAVQPLLPQLSFTDTRLVAVVKRYNECLGGPATTLINSPRERVRPSLGLVGGLERSSVKMSETRLADGNFVATNAEVGAYLGFISPIANRHLALRLEVLYRRIQYADSYVARGVSTVEEREQARFDLSYLSVPFTVRYHFTSRQIRPFLSAGVDFNYVLSYSSYLRSEYTSATGQPVAFEREYSGVTRIDYGLLAGAGLATPGLAGHAISAEARVEASYGFLNSSPMRRLSVLVSIDLTRTKSR